jgi:anti-sigma B factor antagonist
MEIKKYEDAASVTLSVAGRLDTSTAGELESEIQNLSEVSSLIIDFSGLEYISSAGLRVLLQAHKAFAKKSGLKIINANETVLEIFEVTGFKDILDIKA